MPLLHLLILALIQGVTEFLPISSSGHLVLAWEGFDALGRSVPGQSAADRLVLDIAVHVGTLGAVCLYFRRDLAEMAAGLGRRLRGHHDPAARLALNIVIATIPVVIAGFALKDKVAEHLRDVAVIGWTTLGFGLLLFVADRMTGTARRLSGLAVPDALIIGAMQILALIPGTSRAGITMTAARFLGFDRAEAARFSMLLAIPTILGAGLLAAGDLYAAGNAALGLDALIAAGFAFVAAWGAIALLLRWLARASFTPFVVYRIALGLALLWIVYA